MRTLYNHDAFEHCTKKEFEQFLHFSFFEKYLKTFFFLFFCKLATYIKNTAIKYREHTESLPFKVNVNCTNVDN